MGHMFEFLNGRAREILLYQSSLKQEKIGARLEMYFLDVESHSRKALEIICRFNFGLVRLFTCPTLICNYFFYNFVQTFITVIWPVGISKHLFESIL
jgi:hypothetical protein